MSFTITINAAALVGSIKHLDGAKKSIIIDKSVEFYKKGDYMIKRNMYLNQLISARDNGFPKVITGNQKVWEIVSVEGDI